MNKPNFPYLIFISIISFTIVYSMVFIGEFIGYENGIGGLLGGIIGGFLFGSSLAYYYSDGKASILAILLQGAGWAFALGLGNWLINYFNAKYPGDYMVLFYSIYIFGNLIAGLIGGYFLSSWIIMESGCFTHYLVSLTWGVALAIGCLAGIIPYELSFLITDYLFGYSLGHLIQISVSNIFWGAAAGAISLLIGNLIMVYFLEKTKWSDQEIHVNL